MSLVNGGFWAKTTRVALCAAMTLLSVPVGVFTMPQIAFADGANGTYKAEVVRVNNAGITTIDPYPDIADAFKQVKNWAKNDGTKSVTINLYDDFNSNSYGLIEFSKGRQYTLNLNGHMINRDESDYSYYGKGDGEVIAVTGGSSLTINGGNSSEAKAISHGGYLVTDSDGGKLWQDSANDNSCPITGGLITGGACDSGSTAGGIAVAGDGAKLTLNDVTVAGNVSDESGWKTSSGYAGGIGVWATNTTLSLNNSKVVYNHAEAYGGGVYLNRENAKVELSNSSISSNSAANKGGGLYVEGNNSTVTLSDASSIDNNRSNKDGGGIYHNGSGGTVALSDGSSLSGNYSAKSGGAVYSYYDGTAFSLESGSNADGNTAAESGGAFFFDDVSTLSVSGHKEGNAAAVSSVNNNNSNGDDDEDMGGGAVFVDDSATKITLSDGAQMNGNKAKEGGAIYTDGANTSINLDSVSLNENKATEFGGAVYSNKDTTVTAKASSIDLNEAQKGGAFYSDDADSELKIALEENCTLSNNNASDGGAVWVEDLDVIEVVSNDKTATVASNSAASDGGAFYFEDTDDRVLVKGLTMTQNSANTGGAIWFSGSTGIIWDTTIKNNTAGYLAAGVYLGSGIDAFKLNGTVIIDENYVGSLRCNLVLFKDTTYLGSDSSSRLTTQSRIGITNMTEVKLGSYRFINKNDYQFIANLTKRIQRYLFSDNGTYAVKIKQDSSTDYAPLAYIDKSPQCHYLVYSADGHSYVDEVQQDSTVTLKRTDDPAYENKQQTIDNYTLDYWTIVDRNGTKKIETDANQEASFTMPNCEVTATPHYTPSIGAVTLNFNETSAWDKLDNSTSGDEVQSIVKASGTLTGLDGTECVLDSDDLQKIRVHNRKVVEEMSSDGSLAGKTLTYTVVVPKELVQECGLDMKNNSIKLADVTIGASFGTAKASSLSISLEETTGDALINISAFFEKPDTSTRTVTVRMRDVNKPSEDLSVAYYAVANGNSLDLAVPHASHRAFSKWEYAADASATIEEDENTHGLSLGNITGDVELVVYLAPEVGSVDIKMTSPQVGEKIPSAFSTCTFEEVDDRDMTVEARNEFNISWKKYVSKQDGSGGSTVEEVDVANTETVEAATVYKATISMQFSAPDSVQRQYVFASNLEAQVNDALINSVSVSKNATTGVTRITINCTFVPNTDKTYDKVLTSFPAKELVDATIYKTDLPSKLEYSLKDGTVESVNSISWGEPSVEPVFQPSKFSVTGTFEDIYGNTHNVVQEFFLKSVTSPTVSRPSGAYSSSFTTTLKLPSGAASMTYMLSGTDSSSDSVTVTKDTEIEISQTTLLSAYATYGTSRKSETVSFYYSITNSKIITISGGVARLNGVQISSAEPGRTVTVTKDETPLGMEFKGWVGTTSDGSAVTFSDSAVDETTFVMPNSDVKIAAQFVEQGKSDPNLKPALDSYETAVGAASFAIAYITDNNESPVTFTSSDEDVVKVDKQGYLTACKEGVATVTLYQEGNDTYSAASATVTVTVKSSTTIERNIALTNANAFVNGVETTKARAGDVVTVTKTATPQDKRFAGWTGSSGVSFANPTAETTTFTMPNSDVAVSAEFGDKLSSDLVASPSIYTVAVGDPSFTLSYTTSNHEANVSFSSSNPSVVSVDGSGKVSFIATGESTITLAQKASANYAAATAEVTINVTKPVSNVKKINITNGTATIGDQQVTSAAPGTTVIIQSSQVPQGQRFAGWHGSSALIFKDANATTTSFVMPSSDVELTAVFANKIDPQLSVSKSSYNISEGSAAFDISYNTNNNDSPVVFASSNEDVVKVTQKGIVSVIGKGEASISLSQEETDTYAAASLEIAVTVSEKEPTPDPEPTPTPTPSPSPAPSSTYSVAVSGGAAYVDGSLATSASAGSTVTLKADTTSAGKSFASWTGTNGVIFKDAKASETTFVMPSANVQITANYTAKKAAGLATTASSIKAKLGSDPVEISFTTNNKSTPVTFTSSDAAVATVDANGIVTPLGAGTTIITLSQAETDEFAAGSAQVAFTVVNPSATDPFDIAAAKVTLVKKKLVFNGKKQSASVSKVKAGKVVLNAYDDYNVSVQAGKAVGTYQVTITGKGDYFGVATLSYSIVPKTPAKLKLASRNARIKATWTKSKTQRDGIQVRYAQNKKMKGAKKLKYSKAVTSSAMLKKLAHGKRYYVQVRAYKISHGETYWSAWSKKKSAVVK